MFEHPLASARLLAPSECSHVVRGPNVSERVRRDAARRVGLAHPSEGADDTQSVTCLPDTSGTSTLLDIAGGEDEGRLRACRRRDPAFPIPGMIWPDGNLEGVGHASALAVDCP